MSKGEEYLTERIHPRVHWYDRRAVRSKRLHRITQYGAMVGSVILIPLIHVGGIPRELLGGLATVIALLLGAERVGRFGDLWWAYRLTVEALGTEEQRFRHGVGDYALEEPARTQLLVTRCEQILTHEAETWRRFVRSGSGHSELVC